MKKPKGTTNLLITHTLNVATTAGETDTLNETFHSFLELESLGVKQPGQSVLTDFEEKVKFKNGCYLVSLPWKDIHPPLSDNYQLALEYLRSLQRRLRQQPAL